MPLPRRSRLAIELVERATIPQGAPSDPKHRGVGIESDGIRGVGLQLDGVRSRIRRRVDEPKRTSDITVVIPRQLGHDVDRMTRPDRPPGDRELLAHEAETQESSGTGSRRPLLAADASGT